MVIPAYSNNNLTAINYPYIYRNIDEANFTILAWALPRFHPSTTCKSVCQMIAFQTWLFTHIQNRQQNREATVKICFFNDKASFSSTSVSAQRGGLSSFSQWFVGVKVKHYTCIHHTLYYSKLSLASLPWALTLATEGQAEKRKVSAEIEK